MKALLRTKKKMLPSTYACSQPMTTTEEEVHQFFVGTTRQQVGWLLALLGKKKKQFIPCSVDIDGGHSDPSTGRDDNA